MRLRILTALAALLLAPLVAFAHPMGNFSINHHSTIRGTANRITIGYILDFAEIPTFQMFPGGRADAERFVQGLRLELDGIPQSLRLDAVRSQTSPGAGGLPTFRVEMDLSAELPSSPASLRFSDTNFAERIGWKEIVIPGLTGFETDRSHRLTNYPADLLSTPPDVTDVTVRIPAGDLMRNSSSPVPSATTSNRDKDLLTTVLTGDDLSLRMILVGMAIAFVLGAMHALSPGHGKTLVAAYLVGNRGTARHALFLGAVVTLTHTAGVFLLGIVTLFLSGYVVPERLYPWMGFISGLTILGIGIKLFQQRLGKFAAHHHHHDLSRRSLFAMGLSGGIVPCPSALVVLLSAIALHRIQAGLLFIVAFSLGLASVLVAIGVLVVRAGQWLSRFDSHRGTLQLLPIASAVLVTIIGCAISLQSLVATGLIAGGATMTGGLMAVLGFGLLLGLKHATDPDHIVAVTTFVTQERSLLRSCWIGAFWGAGHTLSLAVAGVIVIFLRINISEWLAARLELLVAGMLIVLGGRAVFEALRDKWQKRRDTILARLVPSFAKEGWLRHKENGPIPLKAQTGWLFQATTYPDTSGINKRLLETTNLYGCALSSLRAPARPSAPLRGLCSIFFRSRPPLLREGGECAISKWSFTRPLLVGVVHGAAGSAALMLLVLSTIRSPFEAFLYILVFGLGSILGMLAISFLLALPLQWAKGRVVTSYKPIQLMAGVFSCVFGLYLGTHIWIALP